MFRTSICDIFGIEYHILLAGMGTASTPELAAAVSNAGGLGIIGCAGQGPPRFAGVDTANPFVDGQAVRR